MTDKQIAAAEELPENMRPPTQADIDEMRRERAAWLVGAAESGAFPAPVLAKAAGFSTMSAFRMALSRSRAQMRAQES